MIKPDPNFVAAFAVANHGQRVTLILDGGFQLKGKLVGFDGQNFRITTTQYGNYEKTVTQPAAKVSTYLSRIIPLHMSTPHMEAPGNADFVQEFCDTNMQKEIHLFLDGGFKLKGMLESFDGQNLCIITKQYGNSEMLAIQPVATVSTYVPCN